MTEKYIDYIHTTLKLDFNKTVKTASAAELYKAIGKAFNAVCAENESQDSGKRACYFSAEFLIGKLTKSNLYNLKLLESTEKMLKEQGRSIDEFESFCDPALGNGGLGRLAACFLDSAASVNIPLDGYGIRYRYGYFKQKIINSAQKEEADAWLRFGDAFGIKDEENAVEVCFRNNKVKAVPYIYNVPGYRNGCVNKLYLFQAEPLNEFDYEIFDSGDYSDAYGEMVSALTLSASLYPNDNTQQGRALRLKQQYFFTSAALQFIIKKHISCGKDISKIPDSFVIQLNDTHPTIAIAEFIRLVMGLGESFDSAFLMAGKIFAYTNHTVLSEALEKWDEKLILKTVPEVYEIIKLIDKRLQDDLKKHDIISSDYLIINNGFIHMANLACYTAFSINGVARLHTDIIKSDTLNQWYRLYPKKFNNKTNGVTQRRWLELANPQLTELITRLIGNGWLRDFDEIKNLKRYSNDKKVIDALYKIRLENKKAFCSYVKKTVNIDLEPDFIFCTQVKRIHEYKRQLMNVLSVIHIYLSLKAGELDFFNPTAFIIGGKAAPGYAVAKRIIELINVVAKKINNDSDTNSKLKLIFIPDYNVSVAEKIIPATDISEQISLAGKEASGTSNMKFMMNAAITLGTYDGANIEIINEAGEENGYIFGLRENEVKSLSKSYNPLDEYENNRNIKRAVDTLIDATFLDSEGEPFNDLYNLLIDEDRYMILKDLPDYIETKLKAISDYENTQKFFQKALKNVAASSRFSSDRTVKEYTEDIWFNSEISHD